MGRKRNTPDNVHPMPRRGRKLRRACVTGKARFPDHTAAVVALHHAATARNFCAQDGIACTRREVRSYPCRECNGWHLTSRAAPPAPRSA